MKLPCGCDTIYTSYFDLCDACLDRVNHQVELLRKREKPLDFANDPNRYYPYSVGAVEGWGRGRERK